MRKDFDTLMDESIDNIRKDREKTSELLNDLIAYIANNGDRHKEVGFTLAKYVETLQRSNEQLVKLTSLIKKTGGEELDLSDNDRDKIFEALNNPIREAKKKAR